MRLKPIDGQNVLTVLYSESEDVGQMRLFFCPYSKNITTQYIGNVKAILPGFDPERNPQVMMRPQRQDHNWNLQYSFVESKDASQTVDFYIQDQYFADTAIRQYFCFNCSAPQLYFAGDKVVFFNTKSDVKKGEAYNCFNPLCKESLTFLGIVKIPEVNVV